MRRRMLAACLAAAVTLAGCAGDDAPDGASTAPPIAAPTPTESSPTPEPTATEAGVDVTTVPDEITPEYVDAVMVELDELEVSAYRHVADEGEFGEAYYAAILSLWSEDAGPRTADSYARNLGVDGIQDAPQVWDTEVVELIEATPTCVYFEARQDRNLAWTEEVWDQGEQLWIVLERGATTDLNPTGWRAVHMAPGTPPDACDA